MSLAIFDLDNTLINGDSDHAWGEFLVENSIVDPVSYKQANDKFYADYQAGRLDIYAYQTFALKPLSAHPLAQLQQWRQEFMAQKIAPMRLAQADHLLDRHRKAGDTLLIITATNSFITEPIAKALGIENLLATEPAFDGKSYTGELEGTPCFQEGKVIRLREWLAETGNDLLDSYFYSDSHNDLPLLVLVDNPIAVDPDEQLTHIAEKRDWPIISLRG